MGPPLVARTLLQDSGAVNGRGKLLAAALSSTGSGEAAIISS
jgi:hypothetical protein